MDNIRSIRCHSKSIRPGSRAANVETATIGHIRQLGFADPAIAPMMPAKTVTAPLTLALPGQFNSAA